MNDKIAAEIQEEQEHGRAKYGGSRNNFAHDDTRAPLAWCEYIDLQNDQAKHATPMDWRQRMVKIAGLAVSAIESFDRKSRGNMVHAEETTPLGREIIRKQIHSRKTNTTGTCKKCGKPTFGGVCAKCKGEA